MAFVIDVYRTVRMHVSIVLGPDADPALVTELRAKIENCEEFDPQAWTKKKLPNAFTVQFEGIDDVPPDDDDEVSYGVHDLGQPTYQDKTSGS